MATSKPRITITLTDEQHRILQALSDLQKVSMSSIVTDLLETAMPSLERLSTLLEVAEHAPREVLDGFRSSINSIERDLLQLDLLKDAPGTAARAPARTAVPGASGRAKKEGPPSTNRGVRIPPSNPSKPKRHAGSQAVGRSKKK